LRGGFKSHPPTHPTNQPTNQPTAEAEKYIRSLVEKHGIKTLIFYLPFGRSGLNLISPTPRKEKILQRFFPQLSVETIHQWLGEGAHLARKIANEKIDALREMLKNPSFKDLMHAYSTD